MSIRPSPQLVSQTPVTFVMSDGVARDFTEGPLSQTGGPLDVAIEGKGFFQVTTAAGPRYTRDAPELLAEAKAVFPESIVARYGLTLEVPFVE